MKKIVLIAALFFTGFAHSHGHFPQEQKGYSTSEIYEVNFDLKNAFAFPTCFSIEVNGKNIAPYRTCLEPKQRKPMRIYVESKPNEITYNEVCSIADQHEKLTVRTRMCTKVKSYYAQAHLQ